MNVSIVTPSYNQGLFIERTINSVLSQNIPNLEYLVVDGASTDDTISILQRYDGRIRWVSEKDRGQSHAVNKGILATSGDIIGWLNSDDVYYPGAIETVCAYFEAHPSVDIIYGNAHHIDEWDAIIETYPTEAWNFQRLLYTCFISQPALFFRRRVIEKYGLLNETLQYSMDYEYWLRLGMSGVTFMHVPEVLAGSRLHKNTKTLGSRVKVHSEINTMLKRLLGQVPSRWLSNYAHVILENKNIQRVTRVKYFCCLLAVTLYASLKWNKKVSPDLVTMIQGWIKAGLNNRYNNARTP